MKLLKLWKEQFREPRMPFLKGTHAGKFRTVATVIMQMFLFGLNFLGGNFVSLTVYFKGHTILMQFSKTTMFGFWLCPRCLNVVNENYQNLKTLVLAQIPVVQKKVLSNSDSVRLKNQMRQSVYCKHIFPFKIICSEYSNTNYFYVSKSEVELNPSFPNLKFSTYLYHFFYHTDTILFENAFILISHLHINYQSKYGSTST